MQAKIQAAIDALAPAKAEDSAAKARAEASTKALQEAAARAISADAASRAAVFATARAAESERAAAVRSQRMSVRTWNPLAAAAGGAGAGSGAGAMPTTPGGRPLSGAMGGAGGLIGGIGGIAGRARASVFSLKKPDAGTDAMLASARPGQTIAVSSVEGLVSFGAGDAGQLGDGRLLPDGSCKPVRIDWSKAMKGPPIDIAAGTTHAAVVSADSGLYVFGDNSHGQLGEPATKLKSALRPTIVSGLRSHRVLGVACGTYHTMALTEGGALWAWGTGEKGQLGLGSAARYVPEPRRLDRVAPEKADGTGLCFARVFAGRYTSAGITDKGAAYVWGGGQWGKLGAGPEHASPDTVHWEPDAPVAALVGTPVRDIALGDIFSAFLVAPTPADAATASASATGSTLLVCGALGLTAEDWAARRDAVTWPHPTATFDRRPVVARIAAGRAHLAIISDASLYTAGRGWLGSTHGEDVSEEPMPVPELDVEGIVDVSCGSMHTVVRTLDGRLFAFGANVTGALGTGHFTDMAKPMPGITLDSAHYGKVSHVLNPPCRPATRHISHMNDCASFPLSSSLCLSRARPSAARCRRRLHRRHHLPRAARPAHSKPSFPQRRVCWRCSCTRGGRCPSADACGGAAAPDVTHDVESYRRVQPLRCSRHGCPQGGRGRGSSRRRCGCRCW